MKKLVLIVGIAALAACSEREEAAEAPAAEAPAAEVAAAPTVVATPGKYDVTGPDGTKSVTELKADGTYQDWKGDKVTEKGAWASKDGKTCFDPEGDAAEVCYTESAPAADGNFTATNDKGEVTKVKPLA